MGCRRTRRFPRQPIGVSRSVAVPATLDESVQRFSGSGRRLARVQIHEIHCDPAELVVVFPSVVTAEGQVHATGKNYPHLCPGTAPVTAVSADQFVVASSDGGQSWCHGATSRCGLVHGCCSVLMHCPRYDVSMTADVPTAVHVTPKTLRRVEVGEHAPQESFPTRRYPLDPGVHLGWYAGAAKPLLGMAVQPRCLG